MTLHRLCLGALLIIASARPAAAQTPFRLTLDDALSRAVAASHRLAEAKAREAGAQAAIRTRQAADQPTLNVAGGYTRTNHVDEFSVPQPGGGLRVLYPDIPDNYFTRASFQWPIYTSGRFDALERAAEWEARAAGRDIDVARADLRLEVTRAYWAAATAAESERVLREAVGRAEEHLRNVRNQFAVGLIPPNDVSSAVAQRARQQLQLIEAQNLRRSVLEDLRRLTGVGGEIEIADPLVMSSPPPELAAAARAGEGRITQATHDSRPERQALLERIAAAGERRLAIQAGRRPTVAANAAADYAYPNPRIFPRLGAWRTSWEAGLTVSWNLWDGGRIAAESAEAAAAEAGLRARLAETDSLIALDIKQRLLDVDSANAAYAAAEEGVRSAGDARRVVAERFNVGVAASTDVLDAHVALLVAELDRTRALANIRLAEARLARAQGK